MITAKVNLAYEREYETIEEARADNDNFLKKIMCENAEIQESGYFDESNQEVLGEDN